MHHASVGVTLDFNYLQPPTVNAPCGSAADRIHWVLTGMIPPGSHAIVQMVTRRAKIERSGLSTIDDQGYFYELWDVFADAKGKVTMMAPYDSFAWHDQAGEDTKGLWEIKGVARFIPYLDVMKARASGEPWQQGVMKGAGRVLFTLTQEPKDWKQFSSEAARILKARWCCYPNEIRQETDITGSGRAMP